MTFPQKQGVNSALLKCGATISEMNCVRKHFSAIKGGRLAVACAPARIATLVLSDVPGDDPGIVMSGPPLPDADTCGDAPRIMDKYSIALREDHSVLCAQVMTERPTRGDSRCTLN